MSQSTFFSQVNHYFQKYSDRTKFFKKCHDQITHFDQLLYKLRLPKVFKII